MFVCQDPKYACAVLSQLAYGKCPDIQQACANLGLPRFEFFGSERPQAAGFIAESDDETAIVFRGSDSLRDAITDIDILLTPGPLYGEVHLGFWDELRRFWSLLKQAILDRPKNTLWFTGHSLGGALATLAMADLYDLHSEALGCNVLGLYTFGSPRVGNKIFTDYFNQVFEPYRADFRRYVYKGDIVPDVPLVETGHYEHVNTLQYLDDTGVHDELPSFRIPSIVAHGIDNYVNAIDKLKAPI